MGTFHLRRGVFRVDPKAGLNRPGVGIPLVLSSVSTGTSTVADPSSKSLSKYNSEFEEKAKKKTKTFIRCENNPKIK